MSELKMSDLNQFTGSTVIYQHAIFGKIKYTEGVQYLAQEGEAYWLVDDISAHLVSPAFNEAARKDARISVIHFWQLAVNEDCSAKLTAIADTGEKPFISQEIPYTDFPLDEIRLYAGENEWGGFTLLLPGEY